MTAAVPTTAIKAAMSIAKDLAEGRLAATQLDAAVVAECRALVGFVDGPDDPLWPLHLEVARGVLAVGGIPADELAEWAAVQRLAEGGPAPAVSWIESALADYDDEEDHGAEELTQIGPWTR